jgi:hypothetical protein
MADIDTPPTLGNPSPVRESSNQRKGYALFGISMHVTYSRDRDGCNLIVAAYRLQRRQRNVMMLVRH